MVQWAYHRIFIQLQPHSMAHKAAFASRWAAEVVLVAQTGSRCLAELVQLPARLSRRHLPGQIILYLAGGLIGLLQLRLDSA